MDLMVTFQLRTSDNSKRALTVNTLVIREAHMRDQEELQEEIEDKLNDICAEIVAEIDA